MELNKEVNLTSIPSVSKRKSRCIGIRDDRYAILQKVAAQFQVTIAEALEIVLDTHSRNYGGANDQTSL